MASFYQKQTNGFDQGDLFSACQVFYQSLFDGEPTMKHIFQPFLIQIMFICSSLVRGIRKPGWQAGPIARCPNRLCTLQSCLGWGCLPPARVIRAFRALILAHHSPRRTGWSFTCDQCSFISIQRKYFNRHIKFEHTSHVKYGPRFPVWH